MADRSERNNPPHFEEEEQQREITNNQPQAEPDDDDDDDDDEDYVDDDSDEEDEEEVEEEEEEDSYSEEEEEVEEDEEEDSYSEEEEAEDEEEYMNPSVMSPRVSVNSVEVVGEPNGCGQGGKVAVVAGEGGEVDGLTCPICMGPWTSTGDHQVCCLSCGHLYGLSCIRRWLERRKGSAKCPQCNQKCRPKDVRVIYASRVVVADEESKEKIHLLEAKMALLEKMIERFGPWQEAIHQKLTVIEQFHQEQRTHWQERAKIEDRRYEEQCTFQQEQRTFLQEQRTLQQEHQQKFAQFSQFMQQQAGYSSQPLTPLPPGPAQ